MYTELAIVIIYLLILAVIICGVLITRKFYLKKIESLMRANSAIQWAANFTESHSEVPPDNAMEFIEINNISVMQDAVKQREFLITRARKLFWKMALLDIAAGAGYILFSIAAYYLSGSSKSDDWLGGVGFGIILIVLSLDRYLAFRSQYRAYNKGLSRYLNSVIKLRAFYNKPGYSIYYSGAIISLILFIAISSANFPWQLRAALILSVAFHIFLIARLYISYRNIRNYKLLILRVFGIDKNAKFTFKGLWRYWQHFGSFFTVADKAFINREIKIWKQLLFMFFLVCFIIITLHEVPFLHMRYRWIGVIMFLALVVGFYANLRYRYWLIKKNFISNREALDKRLKQINRWPRKLSNTFKEVPVQCYNNTWKMTVAEFVQIADTILMDLRGFSEERKGCEQEVNLLLDCVPAERVTFLVDATDLEPVKKMIQEAWKSISIHSPNLLPGVSKVTLYIAEKKNSKDIQGIMDILLNATSYAPDAELTGRVKNLHEVSLS